MTVETRRSITDLNVMVAGQGGDGSLTVVKLLGILLARRGLHMYIARNIPSRTRGGHSAALLRGSIVPRQCVGDRIDLLVAFDGEAIEKAGERVSPEGVVLYDTSAGPAPGACLPDSATVIAIPFARLAVRDHRRDLFKNSLVFGVLTRILGVDDDEARDVLRELFLRLPAEAIEANARVLEAGFALADDHDLAAGAGPWLLDRVEREDRILISGNEAIGLGFLAAGGRFYAGYPITPATEILSFLASHLPRFGGVAIQAEDELAAINMAIGAALTGTRAMTASSGPGISLMQEGVSQAGSAEIPLVIVDCQRAGPSTGMPTKPEQSDLNMLVHGGNGDFPRIVLAPGDPPDCFQLAVTAVNLSQQLQGPVYIALDQAVAQDSCTVEPFDMGSVAVTEGRRLSPAEVAARPEYRRYLVTDDGISPWALPGTPGGMSLVTGNERNDWGHVSSDPRNRAIMVDKRMRKVECFHDDLPAGRQWGDRDAVVGLIGIGMELGVMQEASERLADAGLAVSCLQPRTLWPVPGETIEFVRRRERIYVVEHNAEGQLAHLLASVGAPHDRLRGILRYDGLPFLPSELADRVIRAEEARS